MALRLLTLMLILVVLTPCLALAEETVIEPEWFVPEYVTQLLDIARGELGYKEGSNGYTKYGEWKGEPLAQWCAEFLCWCVDQVDQQHGTQLLHNVYPLYSGQNVGKNWFIQQGRYVARNGNLPDWGYQWLKGDDKFITTGSYIPQPGDWMFFTWTSDQDTDHVALVEYCTVDEKGHVTIHAIEGNNPDSVARNTYAIDNSRILGYGTVHDVADWTMRGNCTGVKVKKLQQNLMYLNYLPQGADDGVYGPSTVEAVKRFQLDNGLNDSGIANMETQRLLQNTVDWKVYNDLDAWLVQDDEEE